MATRPGSQGSATGRRGASSDSACRSPNDKLAWAARRRICAHAWCRREVENRSTRNTDLRLTVVEQAVRSFTHEVVFDSEDAPSRVCLLYRYTHCLPMLARSCRWVAVENPTLLSLRCSTHCPEPNWSAAQALGSRLTALRSRWPSASTDSTPPVVAWRDRDDPTRRSRTVPLPFTPSRRNNREASRVSTAVGALQH